METELLDQLAELTADLREVLRAGQDTGITHLPRGPAVRASEANSAPRQPEPTPPPPALRRPEAPSPERSPPRPESSPQRPPVREPRRSAPPPATNRWTSTRPSGPSYAIGDAVGAWGLPPSAHSPTGANAEELLEVRRRLGECTRCRLAQGRKKLVFGVGNPEADLVVLGEGPGFHEDQQGLPFVGRSGEMLDRMLNNVLGLGRHEVYILNVVKCRPPDNRTPHSDEVEACRAFLDAQLAAIKPRIIVCMGSPAAKTLLQTSRGVMSLRGRWQSWGDAAVMCTFHPAYLLRRPEDKRKSFEDLKLVRTRYDEIKGLRLGAPG